MILYTVIRKFVAHAKLISEELQLNQISEEAKQISEETQFVHMMFFL